MKGVYTIMFFSLLLVSCRDKIGFIDNNKLYEEFAGTKELTAQAKENMSESFTLLDSLNSKLSILENKSEKSKLTLEEAIVFSNAKQLRDSIYYISQQQIQGINAKIQEQAWNTLNEYLLEYGKKKGYSFIYGANGTGSLMYASDKKDVTEDVIEFVNKKYAGKN